MILSVTGHRPEKLLGYGQQPRHQLMLFASQQIAWHKKRAETQPIISFSVITGMALGWDQAVAHACAIGKIPFIAAIPCPHQESVWPPESQAYYNSLLSHASSVVTVSPHYNAMAMQRRNVWMVDHSDEVLALCDGTPGGTSNCVRYAHSINRSVWDCWGDFMHFKATGPHGQ